MTDIVQAFDN